MNRDNVKYFYEKLQGFNPTKAILIIITTISMLIVLRGQITIFGSWLVTVSETKFALICIFYIIWIVILVTIGAGRSATIYSILLTSISIYSAADDFYTTRSIGSFSSNENHYVYRNNPLLNEKDSIRKAKFRSESITDVWDYICSKNEYTCHSGNAKDFDKLELATLSVSGIFDLGNSDPANRNKPGCVGMSEETNFTSSKSNFSLIRKSSIGCCDDFAHLTASFLNYLGIENEFVTMPGHIANRAKIDGKWVFADSMTTIIVTGLFDRKSDPKGFYIYPNPNVDLGSRRYETLNLQIQEISYFSDDVHFIRNYMAFPSSAKVDARYLR